MWLLNIENNLMAHNQKYQRHCAAIKHIYFVCAFRLCFFNVYCHNDMVGTAIEFALSLCSMFLPNLNMEI